MKNGSLLNGFNLGSKFGFGNGNGSENGKEIPKGDYGIPGFKQVHVEGDDISLFVAVLIVLYYAPIPFL